MTNDKLRSVLQFYLEALTHESRRRADFPMGGPYTDPKPLSGEATRTHFINPSPRELPHLRFMCEVACAFVDQGDTAKAMRHLGFIQGVLWARGFYALDDLQNHLGADASALAPCKSRVAAESGTT